MTIKTFLSDESGAVTVDWVLLTASVVVMAIALTGYVVSAPKTVAAGIATEILKADISP